MAAISLKTVARPRGRGAANLYPTGKSAVAIQWLEKGASPDKGTPRLTATLVCIAGPSKGQSIRVDLYLVEAALWKLADFCLALGFSEDYNVDPDNGKKLIDDFVGKELVISVGSEKFKQDGKEREGRVVRSFGSLDATIQARLQASRDERLGEGASEDAHLDGGLETDQIEAAEDETEDAGAQA